MGRPKSELGFDVLQVAADRANRPTATGPANRIKWWAEKRARIETVS
jgi:hypothetical protein